MSVISATSVGLGLRRGFINELEAMADQGAGLPVDFFEIAPENWMQVGGRLGKQLRRFTERFPFACHGLSLSVGSPAPLDEGFVRNVKAFLNEHNISFYSEHLSYCSDGGHLYDLMPIPFTEEAVRYVSERIQRIQDILGRRLIIENVSAYAEPGKEMPEPEFVRAVVESADCELLLDVNNVFVNSVNHGYDAAEYIASMPSERIRYFHVAGHYSPAPEEPVQLLVDTHGADVIDPVWALLQQALAVHGERPVLLERDFNFPELPVLFSEIEKIRQIQREVSCV
ncbi:MAG: DUF692 domain-containing protein [Thalassolituus sp.]